MSDDFDDFDDYADDDLQPSRAWLAVLVFVALCWAGIAWLMWLGARSLMQ